MKSKSDQRNMATSTTQKQQPLSEKAKEKLRATREAIERNSKYVKLDIGQKHAYVFDAEKILEPEPQTRDDGSEYIVIPYIVEDERYPGHEKFFRASPQLSEKINNLLEEGHKRLMVEKEKSGHTGRYNVYPLD